MSSKPCSLKGWKAFIPERWRYMPRLLLLLWQLGRKDICLILIIAVINGLVPVVQIFLFRQLIDAAVAVMAGKVSISQAIIWLILFLLASLGDVLLQSSHWLTSGVQERLKAQVQERLLEKAGQLSLGNFERANYYNRLERAQYVLDERLFSMLAFMTRAPIRIITLVSLLAYVASGSLFFPLVLLLGSVPSTIVRVQHSKQVYLVKRNQTNDERMLAYLEEVMKTRKAAAELRLFQLQDYFLARRQKLFRQLRDVRMRLMHRQVRSEVIVDNSQSITFGLVLTGVVVLITQGLLSLGQYASYLNAVEQFQFNLYGLMWDFALIDRDLGYIADLFEYLDISEESAAYAADHSLLAMQGPTVTFEHVSFTYPAAETPVLHDIDLCIRPGERIALIGENGAGKSTLAKLLLGLYQPTEGRILVNGVNLREINPDTWRLRCAAVFQDFVKYHLTARENIAFGEVSQLENVAAIRAAAAKSGADQVIERLAEQYETMLGKEYDENGHELSGGQWQKLAIARAYRRDAWVLVLDEPTAALDAKAEVEVYRQFRDVSHGKSALLISHRLGCARLADRIIVLHSGHIVEQGIHEDLLAQGGHYAEMLGLQAQWYV